MNYFKAAEQILSSLPDLERAVENLQQRENRIVSRGAPKTPAAIDYTKPFTDAKSVNDALTEMLELTEVRRHIKKPNRIFVKSKRFWRKWKTSKAESRVFGTLSACRKRKLCAECVWNP